jgi:ketosteroid isomerase-like protein
MKKTLLNLLACCTFVFFTQTLQAQSISDADQKGIMANYNGFSAAFGKMDMAGIEALLTENVDQITPNGSITRGRSSVVANMKGYMEFLKGLPKPDKVEVKLIGMQSRYLAPGLILATYTEEKSISFGSQTKVEKTTTAVVLKKTNDKWLLDLIALTPVVSGPEMGK